MAIREGSADEDGLTGVLCALTHLDPIDSARKLGLGYLWIQELLNSSYQESECHKMASPVVRLLGRYYYAGVVYSSALSPVWTEALLGFLSLNEKFCSVAPPPEPQPNPGFIALLILLDNMKSTDCGPAIVPLLTSMLSPTHPLQLRGLALKAFHTFTASWFSSQMEDAGNVDLGSLLQALGDPFQFTRHVPPQVVGTFRAGSRLRDGKPFLLTGYSPITATDILIEFASSHPWRDHLHRSNFTSYEEITSTESGRRAALNSMLNTATSLWPEFLSTPAKITEAIRRLEELQCLNTAQVVIMWAWTAGVLNPADRDAWSSVERDTLRFYQTHGTRPLVALKQHITDATIEPRHTAFLKIHYGDVQSPCRVGTVRQQVPPTRSNRPLPIPQFPPGYYTDLRISRVCQLRMLHCLLGCDPTSWEEVVGAEEVDEEIRRVPGHPTTPFPFVDWACDFP